METNRLYSSTLERLDRINLTGRDRAEAEVNLRRATAIVEAFFGAIESIGSGGRKLRQRLRIVVRRQRRRHAAV